jgi:putative ABC transport system ATP-binding protein
VLMDVASEMEAALVVSTHDPAVADRLDQHWPVADGRLTVTRRDARDATCSA